MLYLHINYHTPASNWSLVIAKRTDKLTHCFSLCYVLYNNVALEREADRSLPFNDRVKKEWVYTSIRAGTAQSV
jgi:hypothetical protein